MLHAEKSIAAIRSLRQRIVDAGRRHGLSGREVFRRAEGVTHWNMRGWPDPDAWTPSLEVLLSVERWMVAEGLLSVDAPQGDLPILGSRARKAGVELHAKAYLTKEAESIDRQLATIFRYWSERAAGGPVDEAALRFETLDTLCPDAAVQVYDVRDGAEETWVSRFPIIPGYRGGQTIEGTQFRGNFPTEMYECIVEDVASVVDTGWPLWTLLRRRYTWNTGALVDRSFLRLMLPFKGVENRPKILVARVLQGGETTANLFSDLTC
jgi:hypothetical protein